MLVGALAATQHGAHRLTRDLDVCVEFSNANLTRLAAALQQLGAELRISPTETLRTPFMDAEFLSQIPIGTWRTTAGDLDTLQGIANGPDSRATYEQLLATATEREIAGRRVLVASLRDIVLSKEIANRPKDRAALPELRALLERNREQLGHDVDREPPQPDTGYGL